jgi:tetratricopeptide (TPR) repeat protein
MALTNMRGGVLVALVGIWLGSAARASAQPAPGGPAQGAQGQGQAKESPDVAARRLFEEGRRAFDLGEWQRAITAYRGAYNLKPDAAFLYNIAQAYRLANDPAQAIFFYKSFLRNRPNTPNRAEIEDRIRQLESGTAKPGDAPTAPPPAGAPPASPATPPAPPPPASASAGAAHGARPAALGPPPARAESPSVVTAATAPPPSEPPLYLRPWVWGVAAAVVAGVVIGVVVARGASDGGPPKTALGSKPVF